MSVAPTVLALGAIPPAAREGLQQHFPLIELASVGEIARLGDQERAGIRAIAAIATIGASDEVMELLPKLEIVSLFGVGLDAVDLPAASRRSVVVANTPDVLTEDTADYAIALMLALARRIPHGDRYIRAGEWGRSPFPNGVTVRGRKLGIVGLGRIGMAVATRASAFSMEVHWTGPRPKPGLSLPYHPSVVDLASEVDFLILTCPGGPATEGLIDRAVLDALGPDGFLINIARGSVVDQQALVDALVERRIAGAALDVFQKEPSVPSALLELDNVILEPHIASLTVETRREIGHLMIRNLVDHFAGRPVVGRVG